MTRIENDIYDWRFTSHLPGSVWRLYLDRRLAKDAENVLESHLLYCPGCQEELTAQKPSMAAGIFPQLLDGLAA